MIYLVDDDVGRLAAIRFAFAEQGLELHQFTDASEAYAALTGRPLETTDCILVDLMLPAGREHRLFPEAQTEGYRWTGKLLVEKLLEKDRLKFEKRIAILTSTRQISPTTQAWADSEEIRIFRKRMNPYELVAQIEVLIRGLNNTDQR